jgi:hypothetical protein
MMQLEHHILGSRRGANDQHKNGGDRQSLVDAIRFHTHSLLK